jgi:dienelactone hydrolase
MNRQFDTLTFTHDIYAKNKPEMAFKARSLREAQAWQIKLRRKLIQLLGGFPKERCELKAEIVGTADFPAYTRQTFNFQSRKNPALSVFGYFLLPKGSNSTSFASSASIPESRTPKSESRPLRPLPVIICLPGHGRGVDDIVGINEDGSQRKEYGGYQNDFALQCVDNGFAALAIEQFAFGHRRDERARKAGAGASSCSPASGASFLFGQTMAGWRVYDVIRAIDYLETRTEVDPKRVSVMGISGGGTITFFSSAVEKRVKVAVVSGYFNTFKDSIMSIPHCIDNYIPGILKYAEMYDIAGLMAPRGLFIESGANDNIFPIQATKFAFQRAKRIYKVFKAEDKIDLEEFPKEHTFHGVKAFEFLKKHL